MINRYAQKLANGESIRIRFTDRMKKQLFEEKTRTGKSVSEIVRQSVEEYFCRHGR